MSNAVKFICKDIKQSGMNPIRRVATSLSGGFVVQSLDDASLVNILRLYTGWEPAASFATLREQVRLIEKIEGIDLSTLMTPKDLAKVFTEMSDTKKYPVV